MNMRPYLLKPELHKGRPLRRWLQHDSWGRVRYKFFRASFVLCLNRISTMTSILSIEPRVLLDNTMKFSSYPRFILLTRI